MRALVCAALGDDFSQLALQDVARPDPGPGEVRVRVAAASLNFPDLLMLSGGYQHRPEPPFIPGMDLSGVVDAVGSGVSAWAQGDRVAGGGKTGAFAEYAVVAADGLVSVPDGVDLAAAAAFPAAYVTASVALEEKARLQAGETLLVHGASGGVGMAGMDLGRLLGARVIASTGSTAKVEALRRAGADAVVLTGADMREQVLALTEGRGADVVLDPVGGDVFEASTRCVAFDGRIIVAGFAGGRPGAMRTNHALMKGYAVLGLRAGEYCRRFPERGRQVRTRMWARLAAGELSPAIFADLPLSRWREAFELMRDRSLVGKVVLRP